MIPSSTTHCHAWTLSSTKFLSDSPLAATNWVMKVDCIGYLEEVLAAPTIACAAASRAIGTRNGEQLT